MSINKDLPGVRGVGSNVHAGMMHSLLSPYPTIYTQLFTNFINLNRIPKATITDIEMNLTQVLNFKNGTSNYQTDPSLYNIGINTNSQLYIKTDAYGP